jgi:hypothetical protein
MSDSEISAEIFRGEYSSAGGSPQLVIRSKGKFLKPRKGQTGIDI